MTGAEYADAGCYKFEPYVIAVELTKVPLAFLRGTSLFIDGCFQAAFGIHSEFAAHYNYRRSNDRIISEFARDLEQLPEA